MRRLWKDGFRILVTAGMFLGGASARGEGPPAQAATQIYLDGPATLFHVGQQVTVTVNVANVTNLFGVDVELEFDPHALQVVDSDPSTPGVQVLPATNWFHPDFVPTNRADNSAGTVQFVATELNPTPPVKGFGRLFTVVFRATGQGPQHVDICRAVFLTPAGQAIALDRMGLVIRLVGVANLPIVFHGP